MLDEEHAILAGAVVVLRDPLGDESERLVEGHGALVRGDVTHRTRVRPSLATTAKNRSYNSRPMPEPRCAGATPTKWMYASSGSVCERKPIRKATSFPSSSSATKLVPSKWRKNSLGSIGAISRPPHQALTCWITRP